MFQAGRVPDTSDWNFFPTDASEPEQEWTDADTGLRCRVRRGGGGMWCGYVGVPVTHPMYGEDYYRAYQDTNPHGGLTYAGSMDESALERLANGGLWWLGFDCGHYNDSVPGYGHARHGTYRDINFVREECRQLAAELSAMKKLPPDREDEP